MTAPPTEFSPRRTLAPVWMLAAISSALLIVTGVYFAWDALPTADAGAKALIVSALVVGAVATAVALDRVQKERWGLASIAALVAVVMPTGYGYIGNVLTLALAAWTLVLFLRERRRGGVAQAAPDDEPA